MKLLIKSKIQLGDTTLQVCVRDLMIWHGLLLDRIPHIEVSSACIEPVTLRKSVSLFAKGKSHSVSIYRL